MRKRILSAFLALWISVSVFAALAAPAFADMPVGPSNVWDTFPETDTLSQTEANVYAPSAPWSFETAPLGTMDFTPMQSVYFINQYGAQFSVSSNIAAEGFPQEDGYADFLDTRRVLLRNSRSAFVYTASESGTVELGAAMPITVGEAGISDGVNITICKRNIEGELISVWPEETWRGMGGSAEVPGSDGVPYVFEPEYISISAGEKIYFIMDPNGNATGDIVSWEPTVTYISGEQDGASDSASTPPEFGKTTRPETVETGEDGEERETSLTLALPARSTPADILIWEDVERDNSFAHGNGWRLDAAQGKEYFPMNWQAWNGTWTTTYYAYDYGEGKNERPQYEQFDYGVIFAHAVEGWANSSAMFMSPAASGRDVAFSYEAPVEGVLKLELNGTLYTEADDTVLGLSVWKNDVQIWPDAGVFTANRVPGASESAELGIDTIVTAVHEKDVLHIRASAVNPTSYYELSMIPAVEYTSLEYDPELDKENQFEEEANYSFRDQFSGTQGKDGWWYLYAPIGENETTELPELIEGWAWCAGLEEYNIAQIYQGELLPGNMYDAIIGFKAPYTGSITVFMEEGMWLKSSGGEDAGDGCNFGVQFSSDGTVRDLIPMTYIANGGILDMVPITMEVKKNEYIYFRVNRGEMHNWHDTLHITPAVRYSSIDFDDPGIIEEVDPSLRDDPAAGSAIPLGEFPMIARSYEGAQELSVTSQELSAAIREGTLTAGAVYNVSDHAGLQLGGLLTENVCDLQNICIRTSLSGYAPGEWPYAGEDGEGRFCLAMENTSAPVTLRNFTLEVDTYTKDGRGAEMREPMAAIYLAGCADVVLENVQITGRAENGIKIADSKEGACLTVSGSRIDGMFENGALLFEGGASAYAAVTQNCILNNAGPAIWDRKSSGSLVMNNSLSAETAVRLESSGAIVQNNTVTGMVDVESGLENILVALNTVEGTISAQEASNIVLLMNTVQDIHVSGSVNVTLVENNLSGAVETRDNDYQLVQGNQYDVYNDNGSTNVFGDDVLDPSVRNESGVRTELLPKTNFEPFVGMSHRTTVKTAEGELLLQRYLNVNSRAQTYAIVPPGLYSADRIALASIKEYDIYAYGVMVEFKEYAGSVLTLTNCENVSLRGLVVSHEKNANGQATVIEKADGYVVVQTDPGYLPDLTDPTYYPADPYIEAFAPNSVIPFADISFRNMTYLGDGKHKCALNDDRGRELEVGGKITMRGLGTSVVVLTGSGGIQFEDFSIISGAGFGFQERNGDGGTILNRVAITPKAAPLLMGVADDYAGYRKGLVWTDSEGRLRGPAPYLSTCDATHSTNMRQGPTVVNCLFERMTDDATNISGEFGKVTAYDAATRRLTYEQGDNYYRGLPAKFRIGDRAIIFTRAGELLAEAVVTGEPISEGYQVYTLTLDRDVSIKSGTLIENASANGEGFVFDNCLVDNTRSRGFVLKACNGEIKNCTIRNVGLAAILVKPEIDEVWNECGYAQGVNIRNNVFENTGFYKDWLKSTPITVSGDGQFTADPVYLMHRDIQIQNNIFRDRNVENAVYINGAQAVQIIGNDFGTRKGLSASEEIGSGVFVDGAYNVEVSNNIYPFATQEKVKISARTRKVYGADVGYVLGDYVHVDFGSAYTTDGYKIALTVKNVSDEKQNYGLSLNDTTTPGLLKEGLVFRDFELEAGKSRTLYLDVVKLPGEMEAPQVFGKIGIDVKVVGITEGTVEGEASFNAALQADVDKPVDWANLPVISKILVKDDGTDIAASARFAWDVENLYMKVDVQDDVHFVECGTDLLWDYDSIQLGFDPGREEGAASAGQNEMTIGLHSNGTVMRYMNRDSITGRGERDLTREMGAEITRNDTDGITSYILTLPWKLIGKNGQPPSVGRTIGFNICVNDRDQDEIPALWCRYYMEFYGGIAENKQASNFGPLLLVDELIELQRSDMTVLKTVVEAAMAIDPAPYTTASVQKLQNAIDAANVMLDGLLLPNDQETVEAVIAELRMAVDELEKISEQPEYSFVVVGGIGNGRYKPGSSATATAVVSQNWRFVRWEAKGITLTGSDVTSNPLMIVMPENDVTLTAVFQEVNSEKVPVTGIAIGSKEMTLIEGEQKGIEVTVLPGNATNKNVRFVSSDEAIAQVSKEGTVVAVKSGTAIITVVTDDGTFSEDCVVTVTPKSVIASIPTQETPLETQTAAGSPQTGDGFSPILWFTLLVLSALGVIGLTIYRRGFKEE